MGGPAAGADLRRADGGDRRRHPQGRGRAAGGGSGAGGVPRAARGRSGRGGPDPAGGHGGGGGDRRRDPPTGSGGGDSDHRRRHPADPGRASAGARSAARRGRPARYRPGLPDRPGVLDRRGPAVPGGRPVPGRSRGAARGSYGAGALMQGVSRNSAAAGQERLETLLASPQVDPATVGEDLFGVTGLLAANPGVRRALTDPSREGSAKADLLTRLLRAKISEPALDLLAGLVRDRWSEP